MDYSQSPAYQDLFRRINGNQNSNGGMWDASNTGSTLDTQGQQFASMYKNLTGQDPTPEDMQSFYQNVGSQIINSPTGESGSNYATNQALINPYIQNTYGPQIQKNQSTQQTAALQDSLGTAQDSINKMNTNTTDFLTSPESQAKIKGNLNNNGMLDSGAFTSTMAGLLSQGALQNENNAIQGITIPAEQNILQTNAQPYQNSLQSSLPGLSGWGQTQQDRTDFNMQSELAAMLADKSQPSTAEKDIGMASGAANALGGITKAAGPASTATSYVCLELIKRGLARESDLDLLHWKIMPAVFEKGRAFWSYAQNADALVNAANQAGVNWRDYREDLLDNVIRAKTSLEAVHRYTDALRRLSIDSGFPWDERVYRTSFLDSLPFLPRLIMYKPFVKAFKKAMRMRCLLFLDLPLSEMP